MLKVDSINTFRNHTNPYVSKASTYDTAQANKENIANNNLKGVLLNTYIKDNSKKQDFSDFDEISSRLLIPENYGKNKILNKRKETELFDMKKAMKPLAVAGCATIGSLLILSSAVKNYSKALANKAGVVRPPDLARNINIMEEPHFAFYQALRDPSSEKILGFVGVAAMSVLTVTAKNFIEGVKEIWIKKQNCDIEHDLQENLISVETEVFSGKLEVVNTLLKDTTEYFKEVLGDKKNKNTNFKSFLSFKAKEKKEESNDEIKLSGKNILFLLGTIAGITAFGAVLYKNMTKTYGNLKEFTDKFSDKEIRTNIQNIIKNTSSDDKNIAIKKVSDILKTINAPENAIKEELGKISGITEEEISKALNDIKKAQIYVKAPEALGGVSEKIQYYCYINEERGHLYNWILNPENKFNKYIFLGFCAISASGYVLKTVANAIKDVTVGKQNAKSELNLRKNLVSTEIENFKAKKLSAVSPLIENFNYQMKKGKSKQELKELAENILSEIKNGPPYVYS